MSEGRTGDLPGHLAAGTCLLGPARHPIALLELEWLGGPPGFEMSREALANLSHPEHTHLLDWRDGPFDYENIDEDIVRIQTGRLASMRRTSK